MQSDRLKLYNHLLEVILTKFACKNVNKLFNAFMCIVVVDLVIQLIYMNIAAIYQFDRLISIQQITKYYLIKSIMPL